jgi:hypothetical protein
MGKQSQTPILMEINIQAAAASSSGPDRNAHPIQHGRNGNEDLSNCSALHTADITSANL